MVSPVESRTQVADVATRISEIQSMLGVITGTPPLTGLTGARSDSSPSSARFGTAGATFADLLTGVGETASNGDAIGRQAAELALTQVGTPYVYGAGREESPTNFDCSGLTYWSYRQVGINLGTWTGTQKDDGVRVADYRQSGGPLSSAQVAAVARPGDLIFMKGGDGSYASGYPGHVGIYIGNGQMVHAPKTGDVVRVASINERSDIMYIQRVTGAASAQPTSPLQVTWSAGPNPLRSDSGGAW